MPQGDSPYEGPVSRYLNRPVSRRIAAVLAGTPVTPNQVSVAALAIAAAAGGVLALGWNIAGAILIHVSSVADGADGDLARAKGASSTFGGVLDAALDRWADVLIIAGMAAWSVQNEDWELAPAAGFAAMATALLVSYSRARIEASAGVKGGGLLFGIASRDVRLLIAAVGTLVGEVYFTLWLLAGLGLLTVAWRLVMLPRALS
jgi:phosphatidylglycerophosphate synthase